MVGAGPWLNGRRAEELSGGPLEKWAVAPQMPCEGAWTLPVGQGALSGLILDVFERTLWLDRAEYLCIRRG